MQPPQRLGLAAVVLTGVGALAWLQLAADTRGAANSPLDPTAPPPLSATLRELEAGAPPTSPATDRSRTAIRTVADAEKPTTTEPARTVRVTDPTGVALAEIELVVTNQGGSRGDAGDTSTDPVSFTTDESGEFDLPAGTLDDASVLRPADPTWVALRHFTPSTGAKRPGIVVLAHAARRSGSAVDEHGTPIRDVSFDVRCDYLVDYPVPLDDVLHLRDWTTRARTYTDDSSEHDADADGRFEIGPLPAGLATIVFDAPGFVPQSHRVEDTPPYADDLRIVLVREAGLPVLISGTVRDSAARPLADAHVGLGHEHRARSGTDGRFSFEVPATAWDSTRELWATHAHYAAVRLDVPDREADAIRQTATGPHRVFEHDFVLEHGRVDLAIRVVEADGTPVAAGLHVYPWLRQDLGGTIWEDVGIERPHVTTIRLRTAARTDDEGRCTIPGMFPETYRLRVLDRLTGFTWNSEPLDVAAASRAGELELRLPPGRLRDSLEVRVVDRAGNPLAEVQLAVNFTIYIDPTSRSSSTTTTPDRPATDSDGCATLRNVPQEALVLARGETIVSSAVDVPRDHPDGRILEMVVDRVCRVRIDATSFPGATAVGLADADGRLLMLTRHIEGGAMSFDRYRLQDGKTGIVSTSERAVTAVVFGEREELTRLPVRLDPTVEVNELRL